MRRSNKPSQPVVEPLFYRAREAAAALGVSESQIGIWRRQGLLTPINIPEIRATRYAREDVEALARSWRASVESRGSRG